MNRGSGDIYEHISWASQISDTGYFPITDVYPIMHIWLSILHNFFTDFIILTLVLSIVFFYLYVLCLYILGKTILGTKIGGIFISIFGIPLIFSYGHYAFYPFLFALFIIPLILYLYRKITHNLQQKNPFYICVIILSFFIVFCHPMITVFLIIMFSTFAFYELLKRWKRKTSSLKSNILAVNILSIIFITFSFWLLQFRYYLNTLQKIVFAVFGQETHTSILEQNVNTVATSNASIWLVIDRFIKMYGSIFLYFSISLFFLLYIIYQYFQNKKIDEDDLVNSIQFCVAFCIGIALATGYFVIFEPIRAAMYGLIFATIICGLFFYRLWSSSISRQGLITSISIIITVVCMLTMLTLYTSPWTGGTNPALTYGDKEGIDWILENRYTEIPLIIREEGSLTSYASAYYGAINASKFQILIEYPQKLPSNFGYSTNHTIGDSYAYLPYKEVYMTTTLLLKLEQFTVPVERRYKEKSFLDRDFSRLNSDPTVNKIYSGHEFEVWSVEIP